MTLHTPAPRSHLPLHPALDSAPVPTFILEAILTGPAGLAIAVPGWTIRVWPVARLGDATLEAQAAAPGQTAADLAAALERAGIIPLGPLRVRHT